MSRSSNNNVISLQELMRDKFGNYVIQRVVDISNETQRKIMIDKILKAAASMKKHKSHARHVFTYLEKHHGVTIVYNDSNDADSCSKKSETSTRKSSSTTGGPKLSTVSRDSGTQ